MWEWTRWLLRASSSAKNLPPISEQEFFNATEDALNPWHSTEYNSDVILKMQKDNVEGSAVWEKEYALDEYSAYELLLAETARSYNDVGDLDKAREQLRRLSFERPDDPGVWSDYGAVLQQLTEHEEAEKVLR